MDKLNNIEQVTYAILQTSRFFTQRVEKQVNVAMTLRNWMIGYYIVEYEQGGEDRAAYGNKILETIASGLKQKGLKGMGETNLKLFRQFYSTYPQIRQTLSDNFSSFNFPDKISQMVSGESKELNKKEAPLTAQLVNNLSFSHFIELFKADSDLKRRFYELECIKNNWGVRELKRAMNSLLFERTGLSKNKKSLIVEKESKEAEIKPEDVFRNPYILEFLNLEERAVYSESDLEQSIIDHLQHFLLELGRGFCFEARQKRITFDNTHYRIDLVFYHRILKCHVLIDLKIGEFTHADAGQMNVYLNYYKENEIQKGDNPPVGIILCAGKNESLVKYATTGLTQKVFVSKYMINLPSEKELENIIKEEQQKLL